MGYDIQHKAEKSKDIENYNVSIRNINKGKNTLFIRNLENKGIEPKM